MAGQIELEFVGLAHAEAVIAGFASAALEHDGLMVLGAVLETQTRERFDHGQDPEGNPWAPWSRRYAATRHKGQSILVSGGHLRDSIAWTVSGAELTIGSNLVYAAIHQFGSGDQVQQVKQHERTVAFGRPVSPYEVGPYERQANMPARAYMGVSEANAAEAEAELLEWLAHAAMAGSA